MPLKMHMLLQNYSYLNNPLVQLAQIPGGFLHKATHGDTYWEGCWQSLSDN